MHGALHDLDQGGFVTARLGRGFRLSDNGTHDAPIMAQVGFRGAGATRGHMGVGLGSGRAIVVRAGPPWSISHYVTTAAERYVRLRCLNDLRHEDRTLARPSLGVYRCARPPVIGSMGGSRDGKCPMRLA
jgi:hypothetical protein